MAHLIEFDAGNKPSIFAVVAILVVADRTRDTGRFNLVQGALATAVGLGTALSTTFGGKLIQHFNYRISFLALGAIALFAFLLVATAIPETLADRSRKARQSGSGPSSTTLPQELPA
jgi:MFS family permease